MEILTATGGIAATNAYLVADHKSGDCVLFDAPDHTVAPLLNEAEARGWRLAALWLTHGHFDHIADHAAVRNRFPNSRIVIHELDVPKLEKPGALLFRLPFTIAPTQADVILQDGNIGTFGGLSAEALHTPGHSPGHVCYYFKEQKTLIGGDLIIGGAIGRTDFPDCNVEHMQESLKRIMQLPDETRLFPGHGPATTLGHERKTNRYLQLALAGRLAEL